MSHEFRREFIGEFVKPSQHYLAAYNAWLAYYEITDRYDRENTDPAAQNRNAKWQYVPSKR